MSFTYIIPFKYTEDRFQTLTKVLKNIQTLDCEIIIIEQGTESILPSKNIQFELKYIFLENTLPFNKSWSLNVAYKQATFNKIVFGDADNLMDTDFIKISLSELDEYEMVSPHTRLVDLNLNESNYESSEIFKISRPGRGETDHQKMTLCGAMTMFQKEALDKIGGWPEEFIGWGGEDDAMSVKVQHFLKWKCLDYNCYHLWHERVNPDRNFYLRNVQIYNSYMNVQKEVLWEHINKIKSSIGDKNKQFLK